MPEGLAVFGSANVNGGILKIKRRRNGLAGTAVLPELNNGQLTVQFALQAQVRIGDSACCTAGRNQLRLPMG